jgi:hypothetical protein
MVGHFILCSQHLYGFLFGSLLVKICADTLENKANIKSVSTGGYHLLAFNRLFSVFNWHNINYPSNGHLDFHGFFWDFYSAVFIFQLEKFKFRH